MNTAALTDLRAVRHLIYFSFLFMLLFSLQSKATVPKDTGDADNTPVGSLFFIVPMTTHDPGWRADVIIANKKQRAAQINITAYDINGFPLFFDNPISTLEPGETSVIDTLLFPPNISSLRVETKGVIDGSVNFGTVDGKKSATVAAFSTGSKQLNFPPWLDGDISYRSLVLFNPNDEFSALSISAFDKDGQVVTPTPFDLMPMAPKETRTIALSKIIDANIQSNISTVRITSIQNLMGFQIVDDISGNLVSLLSVTSPAKSVLATTENPNDTYDYKDTCPTPSGGRYWPKDIDIWKFYKCECTSYVADKLNEKGLPFSNFYKSVRWSDAKNWNGLAKSLGISRGSTPRISSVAWWGTDIGPYGHVAFVEAVNADGTVSVSEYNFKNPYDFGLRRIAATTPKYYIYFLNSVGLPGNVTVTPTSGTWTTSPQYINVSSTKATKIYYTLSFTTNGSVPSNPPEPSATQKTGEISGSSGKMQLFAAAGQYKRIKVRFRGYNSTGYSPATVAYSYTLDLRDKPGTVSVNPASGNWTSSPQHLNVSSSGATTLYYTMVNTFNGSTPANPPAPTPSANNGSLNGSSGVFVLYSDAGQHKRSKLRFVGCNNIGCGPVTGSYLYAIDLHQPSYEGWIDDANCTTIFGWAWDTYLAETPINVDIYDGSSKIATVPANQFRQDLLNAGKGNGYHGFTYSTPSSLKDGNSHTIYVKHGGTGSNLNGSPKALTCAGYASVSQGLNVSPTPVKLGQNFTIGFTLKETKGIDKTFENVAIAILDPSGTFIFDFVMYNSVTVTANGTKSFSAQNYIYPSRPQGTYKTVARGKVAGGNWFDFDTVDSGVNPRNFAVVQ